MARGHGEKLNRKQEAAIAALLQRTTIRAAAAAVPVNEKTLRDWLKLPHFAAAFRDARRQVVEAAIARVQQLTGKATDALDAALDSQDVSEKIRAAALVLKHTIGGIDTADTMARLEEMERQLAELTRGGTGGDTTDQAQNGTGTECDSAGPGPGPDIES